MKYFNVFDSKSELDLSVSLINHGDGAYVFEVKQTKGIEDVSIYGHRHQNANCVMLGSVNMAPVKLDSSSTKKTPAVADVLYSTADGKLTLDAQTNNVDNTPIAICVIPEVTENFKNGDDSAGAIKTARFVSLNYMNYTTPTTGNKDNQYMYFGNYGTTIGNVKGGTDKTSYIGGKWNTQQCLSKVTNKDVICDGVANNSGKGYCAPVCCCVVYSTPGTKSGDWYLPSIGELYQIYANKVAINEKRTAIKGSGFLDHSYWSSREDSSGIECYVYLDYGNVGSYYGKNNDCYVLGFLALEVPAEK